VPGCWTTFPWKVTGLLLQFSLTHRHHNFLAPCLTIRGTLCHIPFMEIFHVSFLYIRICIYYAMITILHMNTEMWLSKLCFRIFCFFLYFFVPFFRSMPFTSVPTFQGEPDLYTSCSVAISCWRPFLAPNIPLRPLTVVTSGSWIASFGFFHLIGGSISWGLQLRYSHINGGGVSYTLVSSYKIK
jgi:hypothetical protein